MTMTTRLLERFWSHVDVMVDGCWVWTAATNKGYGQWNDGSRMRTTHRTAFELAYGPVPAGLVLDHLCRNKACLRPDHMEAVTQAENVRRGRSGEYLRAKTHCPQGHPYDGANLIERPGRRECRECRRATRARYRARLIAATDRKDD